MVSLSLFGDLVFILTSLKGFLVINSLSTAWLNMVLQAVNVGFSFDRILTFGANLHNMVSRFEIDFDFEVKNYDGMTSVYYNMRRKLEKFKYVGYKKINIVFAHGISTSIEIDWEDKKSVRIRSVIPRSAITSGVDGISLSDVYREVFNCLHVLWEKNNWNKDDLVEIYDTIKKVNYEAKLPGRSFSSPDKKKKAQLFFDIYPKYTDYYLQFSEKKSVQPKIHFLKGRPNPDLFFGFFGELYWRDNEYFFITDFNKEIFFIFSIKDNSFSIEFQPKINSLDTLKGYVKAFQSDVPHEESLRLLGFRTN